MNNTALMRAAGSPPFSSEKLFRRFGPVVGLTLLALLYAAPPRSGASAVGPVLQAAFLAALTAMATVVLPWNRLPRFARVMPAFVYLIVVFLAREAPGDTGAPYAQIVMIPVVWLALYGGRREMTGGLLAAGGALFAPLLLVGGGQGDLRHAAILFGSSTVLGFTIQLFFAQLRVHTSRLYDLGGTDHLTGAANRRTWEAQLQRAMAIARKNGRPLSLVMFDIDGFKAFNDRHGHQGGDRLLKGVAARWTTQLRTSDVLARLGGDEFGLIMQNCPQWAARAIAERLCEAVPMGVTSSAGVAAWDGVESAQSLMSRADRGLYRARNEGGNRVAELWSERALTDRTPTGADDAPPRLDGWSSSPSDWSSSPNSWS